MSSGSSTKDPIDVGWALRFAAIFAGAVLAFAIILYGCFGTDDALDASLPPAVSSVSPVPGAVVTTQVDIGVDLDDTYAGVLVLDGVEIPEDQLVRVTGLGQVTFRPGPGRIVEELEPGEHTVTAVYWPVAESRETSARTFTWTFRSTA